MITIICWTIGILCIAGGALWLYLNIKTRPLLERELQLMKKPGHLGSPSSPQGEQRVREAEEALRTSKMSRIHARLILVLGILTLLLLLLGF